MQAWPLLFTIGNEEAALGSSSAISRYFTVGLFAAILAAVIEIFVF
jgi:hypothetical protein